MQVFSKIGIVELNVVCCLYWVKVCCVDIHWECCVLWILLWLVYAL